ncbi:MAG: hypothetical protein ACK5KN_07575 [Dysgonomonas sp.]|uniref:hypothetical protein n=1 Tax=Dysgonomonas sp. TaxID=1891233 RepID=UPI003A8A7914
MENPYEYHNNKLGVQGRFLVSGRDAHPDSLQLISDAGLRMRFMRNTTTCLRQGCTNTPMLVQFDTIPLNWQKAVIRVWGDPPKMIRPTIFERYFERDTAAFDFYTLEYRFEDGSTIDNKYIDEYVLNASVLNTAKKIYDARYKIRKEYNIEVGSIWAVILTEIKRFKVLSGHTLPSENDKYLRRKYNRYMKEGYASLISGKHKNNNARKVDDTTEQLLNNMFAGQEYKPNPADITGQYNGFLDGSVEVINTETGEYYDPKDYKPLKESTIRNYLMRWSNKIATYTKRSGDRQSLMSLFRPYHSLEHPELAGSIISIDDRQPPFEYAKNTRMWFYNGIDLGSEAFTTWVYGKTKEGIITDFYRQMVRNYHAWGLPLPAEMECEMNLNAGFRDTFLKEGSMFQYIHIEANNARGKRIEPYYRPLRYKLEKKREGWLARPFALSEPNQAGAGPKKIIPYDVIVEGCLRDIETWNNMEHSRIKGMSRWDVFMSMQNPNVRPTNYHGILPYLGYRTKSSVRTGIIRFREKEFLLGNNDQVALGNDLIKLMLQVEGQDIDIYWLDDNNGDVLKAHIYKGTQFICEAVKKPAYNKAQIERTAQDLVAREVMSKYVATVDGFGTKQRKALDNVIVIDNRPVTIGNSFKISGLSAQVVTDQAAPVLEDQHKGEDLNTIETTFKRSFADSF